MHLNPNTIRSLRQLVSSLTSAGSSESAGVSKTITIGTIITEATVIGRGINVGIVINNLSNARFANRVPRRDQ
ncbi:MAG: hypothetical protein WCI52_01135 [bacterium]